MDGLTYAFRHNFWATRRLIEVCRDLAPEQLEATAPGAMGSVRQTLKHILDAEGHRLRQVLTGTSASWERRRDETPDLDTLAARADENERFWNDHLASVDADRPVPVDWQGQLFDVKAGVVLAQLLHHGNAHREQICTILTVLGVEPPDVSAWAYGGAAGYVTESASSAT